MMKGILGKKIGMTQIFDENGMMIPVTVVEAGPCLVTQVKTVESDGYNAVQVAFDPKKESRATKATQGHFARAAEGEESESWHGAAFIREFREDETPEIAVGSAFKADVFEEGQKVQVSGLSRGKGFLGVMARHNFGGGPDSHGSNTHRRPGSIGMAAYPAKVIKGMRMAGHKGNKNKTITGLTVVKVDAEKNHLYIRGGVPGSPGTYLTIKKQG